MVSDRKNCGQCHACIEAFDIRIQFTDSISIPLSKARMILCPICGNKRCPKASDHELACTGSNESGQAGSIYPRWRPDSETTHRAACKGVE